SIDSDAPSIIAFIVRICTVCPALGTCRATTFASQLENLHHFAHPFHRFRCTLNHRIHRPHLHRLPRSRHLPRNDIRNSARQFAPLCSPFPSIQMHSQSSHSSLASASHSSPAAQQQSSHRRKPTVTATRPRSPPLHASTRQR